MPRAAQLANIHQHMPTYGSTVPPPPPPELAAPLTSSGAEASRPVLAAHGGRLFLDCCRDPCSSLLGCCCPCLLFGRTLHRAGMTRRFGTGVAIWLATVLLILLCCALLILLQWWLDPSSLWRCFLGQGRQEDLTGYRHGKDTGAPLLPEDTRASRVRSECLEEWRESAGGPVDNMMWLWVSFASLWALAFWRYRSMLQQHLRQTLALPELPVTTAGNCCGHLHLQVQIPIIHCCCALSQEARAVDAVLLQTASSPPVATMSMSTGAAKSPPLTVVAAIRPGIWPMTKLFVILAAGYAVLACFGFLLRLSFPYLFS